MPNETFVFDSQGVAKIQEIARRVLADSQNSVASHLRRGQINYTSIVGLSQGQITGMSGSTPGSGTVHLYRLSGGSLTQVFDSNGSAVGSTVYNVREAVPDNTYVNCDVDRFGVLWVMGPMSVGSILIRNDHSASIPRYGVLGITGSYPDPGTDLQGFLDNAILLGDQPLECDHVGKFAIAQQIIEPGAIGPCVAAGVTQAKVDVQDTAHDYCEVVNENIVNLKSYTMGSARILAKESGTGVVWALIRIGEFRHTIWKFALNESMGATTTGQADAALYQLDKDPAVDDPVVDPVTVEDSCGIFASGALGDCGLCVQHVVNGSCRYWVIQMECPA